MFVKHIICSVIAKNKGAFSAAQEKWYQTKEAPGFLGQLGGWELTDNTSAHILSFWISERYLKNFMDQLHDTIFENNKQESTYNSIRIYHYNAGMDPSISTLLPDSIQTASNLRITDPETILPENTLKISHNINTILIGDPDQLTKTIAVVDAWKIV